MKKFILSLGLVAMMLNLTNCAQYDDVNSTVEPQGDFEIYASVSRTANDGLNTVWSTGDDLGVFHAVTDGTTYTKDGQFKLNNIETSRFLGNVNGTLDSQEEYDWYAMYPYSSYVPGPANTGSGYMTIGCASNGTQTQTGNNSLAHVAGKNYPMVGKAYAVPAGLAPALAMTHVATLLEFEVTNSLEEAITVSSIQFTAPEAIVGTFYIDFTDIANITATSSGDSYTSATATLAVNEGVAIEKGTSAKFYLPVAPFVAKAGKNLSVVVTATSATGSGAHTKDLALTSDVTFSAGKIKTVKVDYNTPIKSAEDIEWVDNAYNLVPSTGALSIGDKVVFVSAQHNKAMGAQGSNNRSAVAVTKNTDNNTVDIDSSVSVFTIAAGNAAGTYAFKTSGSKYLYAASSSSNHLKEEATLTANSSWNISIVNGATTVKATGSNRSVMQYNSESDLFSCYASASQGPVCIYKLVGEYVAKEPAIVITANAATIAYDATSGSAPISTTYGDGWTLTATSNVTWISNLVYDATNTTFTFDAEANEGDEREATITITATREGYDNVTKQFTIKQAAKPTGEVTAGTPWSHTFKSGDFSANGTKTLSGLAWTLAGNGGYWGWDNNNGKGVQFGSSGKPYKSMTLSTSAYQGGVETIKINTSGASSINASFTVSVGGKQIGNATKLTKTATEYTFTSTELLTGDIVISYTQTSSKAIYIKSISIN